MAVRYPYVVYDFYNKLDEVVTTHTILLSLIFSSDESGFSSDPFKVHAIDIKGNDLSQIFRGSGRENTTVLASVSAMVPPIYDSI